jgi:energy-coupling factor transporter ATP-binding protein EcfA2
MPYITHLRIDRARNVRDLAIDLSVPSPGEEPPASEERPYAAFRHLILTGPNGSGKSGVLEAVAKEIEKSVLPDPQQQLALFEAEEDTLRWSGDPLSLADAFALGDLITVYLQARRSIRRREVRGPSRAGQQKPGYLGPAREVSSTLRQFLVNKHVEMTYATANGDSSTSTRIRTWFDAFQNRLRRLTEDSGLTIEYDQRAYTFRFRRSDEHVFDLDTLADGHAAVLALLAELLIRVDAVQEMRRDFTFEPEGVIVVDEIETHLHLSLQEQILPFLTEIFPRFQLIVATHSPAVIASIPGAVVYDLAKKKQTLSDHFRGVRYGTLMTEHFGISSEIDLDSTDKLLRLRALTELALRSPEQERELGALSALLSMRSPTMAVEVWMAMERLGDPRAAGTTR